LLNPEKFVNQFSSNIGSDTVASRAMWATVLVLALISAMEPTRIGICALLVGLPRPMSNLLAYWLGLMTSGFGFALITLVLLRDFVLPVVNTVTSVFESPVVPPIQIAVGVLALSTTAMLAVRYWVRQAAPVRVLAGCSSTLVLEPEKPTMLTRLGVSALLEGGSVKVAYFAGLGTSMPPVEYGGAIMAILATGAAAGTRVSAALAFVLVAFAVAELPLVAYLVSPAKTRAAVTQLHNWLRTHSRPLLLAILGLFGVMMVAGGAGWV
jgi:hypothetical protein